MHELRARDAWVCVSLSLSHDSSGGPTRPDDRATRPGLDRSIGRSRRSIDRSIDRSVGRSCVPCIICIDTYIIINIPYQYIHHRLNPLHLTPQPYTGPRAAFTARHFISFVVSSSSSSNFVVARPTAIDDERDDEIRRSRSSSSSRASVDRSSDDDDDDG